MTIRMFCGFAAKIGVVITIAFVLGLIGLRSAVAQVLPPPPPVQQIGLDPIIGPICAGPAGPGPCQAVQHFLWVQLVAAGIPVQQVGFDPMAGPICAGPAGPGPCNQVRTFIALQLIGAQQFRLPTLAGPVGEPICLGPLGPGPCSAVQAYLMQLQSGGFVNGPFDPRQVQLVNSNTSGGAICAGPIGPMPCGLVGQTSLDRMSGAVSGPAVFGVSANLDTARRAQACARQAGLDVAAFAGCAGQQIILPRNEQAVLDCAVSSIDTPTFANCAAPKLGIRLSDDQRVVAGCATTAGGDAARFASCAGGQYLNRALTADERAILACGAQAPSDPEAFARCASGRFLAREQQAALNCALSQSDAAGFALCAAPNVALPISDDQRILARCAFSSEGDPGAFALCAGGAFAGRQLTPDQQAVLGCAAGANGDSGQFMGCAATRLFGDDLSREQRIALQCAAQSRGDPGGMAVCAGANMFNLQLNPEMQIAVQCVASTGGQPYAAAGCIASRLTARELTKCLTDGFGGRGCFGDSNDLVGRNGLMGRTLQQIAGGPNSVFNNPGQLLGGPNSFVNNPGQIWGGDNSFVRNPGQIWGGDNSFVRNPGQMWGGANSVFNNPSQLAPKPVQVGSIGGKRICLPWC